MGLRALGSRWVLSFAGTVLLAALVWVFGPLLPALEASLARLAVIQAMVVVWLAANALLTWRRRARDAALASGLAGSATAVGEEMAAVAGKLRTALGLLDRSGRRGALREQPWYVIIGPPGAGKTTALLNAGLTFPLAEQLGTAALAGVGGTRLLEWWFTEHAVLIDTAGRYTTQDSDTAVDRAGWEAFLALLKRTRPRQPINGVIVAISLPTVIAGGPGEAAEHAAAIARRIAELELRLGVRMPVYALLTKADLIAGFNEFFEPLDRDQRDQVWGVTFPLASKSEAAKAGAERFAAAFGSLVERLGRQMGGRLQAEARAERRGLIVGFPAQFASLEKPLASFLQAAFSGTATRPAPMLRGVYFASGTQEGTPIDRLTGAMTRAFGIDQRRAGAVQPGQGRSYFLGRLLREVVLGEAMLVREAPGAARRRLALRLGGFSAVALATVVAGAAILGAGTAARRETEAAAAALGGYEQAAAAVPLDPVADGDLRQVAALLDRAQALDRSAGEAWLGLDQGAKLQAGERAVYRDGLAFALLPRLIWRLEAQMRGSLGRPDALYNQTRIYLMLGNAGPLNKDQVRSWLAQDWQDSYPAAEDAGLRDALGRHLDALLAEPLPDVALDGALVAGARVVLARVPAADRVYAAIRNAAAAQGAADWRPLDVLGAAGAAIFRRNSGKPMTDGISGFLTASGFRTVLLPALDAAARASAGESWVLGSREEIGAAELQDLSGAVLARYVADYQQAWDGMLADLNVRPLQSLVQAAQDLYVLASPESPMRALRTSLAHELDLQAAASGNPAGGAPAQALTAHYRALIDSVATTGGSFDAALRQLADIQQTLAKLAALPVATALPAGGETIAAGLGVEAARLPPPVSRWMSTIAASATALRTGNVRGQAALAYNAPGGPAQTCQASLNGRYPFGPAGRADMPPEEFARLFAPGAALDSFFNLQLKPFVDTSSPPWKPQPIGAVQPPIAAAELAQVQRAETIRDSFFAGGRSTPAMQFDIEPLSLGAGTTAVKLDFGGVSVATDKGPGRATHIVWPGADPAPIARLGFQPPGNDIAETGPWALLRLFAHGRVQPGKEAGTVTLVLQSGLRQASFLLRTGSVNPFAPGLLADFRCPVVQ